MKRTNTVICEIFYKNIPLSKLDFQNDVSIGYVPAVPTFLERKTVAENIEYIIKLRSKEKGFITAKLKNALVEYGLDFIENKKHYIFFVNLQ